MSAGDSDSACHFSPPSSSSGRPALVPPAKLSASSSRSRSTCSADSGMPLSPGSWTSAPDGRAALSSSAAFHFAESVTSGRKRSEEHTSELQSLMRISYAVFCLKKKNKTSDTHRQQTRGGTYGKCTSIIHKD